MPLSSEQAILFTDASFPSKCSPPTAPLFAHFSAAAAWKKSCVHQSNGCLDVMRASSPPRSKEPRSDAFQESQRLFPDSDYFDWVEKYPSALESFKEILDAAKGKQLALFLDYDGTLSPIVEDPASAFMSEEMRAAVKQVAGILPTSIITGRSREKVYEFIQLPELYYAGSHGMDIMGPARGCHGITVAAGTLTKNQEGEDVVLFQPASEFLSTMSEVCGILEERMKFIAGSRVEDNKFCISVHFRQVNEEDWERLANEVQGVLKEYPKLSLTYGRKVLEIRPSIKWDKGKAVEFLLEALGLGDSRDVLPLYIGDDRTDEDAFNMLNKKFNGYGILVSNVPKTTAATYSLRDTSEVHQFLNRLVQHENPDGDY